MLAIYRNNRIKIYCTLILLCSIVGPPDDYKIDKRNLLNQWFVKLGWFWTNSLMLPVLFLSIRSDDRDSVTKAIFRIISSTLLWYCSVNLFQFIDSMTGFDISGHTFLLMFSNLLISSELKLVDKRKEDETGRPIRSDGGDESRGKLQLETFKRPLLLLTLLWDFMLLQTALYYHTLLQKAIAALWAIGAWYVLQVGFYSH